MTTQSDPNVQSIYCIIFWMFRPDPEPSNVDPDPTKPSVSRIRNPGCKGAQFSVGKYLFLIWKSPVPTNHLSLNPFNPTSER